MLRLVVAHVVSLTAMPMSDLHSLSLSLLAVARPLTPPGSRQAATQVAGQYAPKPRAQSCAYEDWGAAN